VNAPFPYFGGKRTVAHIVWQALGQPKHYLEPFFGSGAVLLNRPNYNPQKHMETVCDKDGFVANAWRGMQFAPDELAKYCDWPVNHADLNGRRKYLNDHQDLLVRLCEDPEWFDAKIAGYWIWAMSCWIGSGLIRKDSIPRLDSGVGVTKGAIERRPQISNDRGINRDLTKNRPQVALQGGVHALGQIPSLRDDRGINQQIPLLNHETGVCRRPCFGAESAHGVHKISIVSEEGAGLSVQDPYTPGIWTWFRELSERLRRVRVVCGDWTRVCGGDWQDDRGDCGIFFDPKETCGFFLDPPYDPKTCNRDPKIYAEESATVANDVQEWCRKRAERKTYRIVLAGYFEEHESLLNEGWTVHRWSAHGGFANRGKGKTRGEVNRHKEALFFSPHCHPIDLTRFGLEYTTDEGSVTA
jgi:site-specific DNA-adenine methylase